MSELGGEPFAIYDAVVLNTTVAEQQYPIGTVANLIIPNIWPSLFTVPTPLPMPAKRLVLICTQNALVRLLNPDLIIGQASGGYGAGVQPQLSLVAGIPYTIDFPTSLITYQRETQDGVLRVHAYA